MLDADFERIWVPRIGEPAARRLHRGEHLLLLIPLMFLAVAIVFDVLDGPQSTVTFVFALLACALGIVTFAIWLRSRVLLARELSEWLGVRVRWFQLPRMSQRSFDAWCRRRGIAQRVNRAASADAVANGDASSVAEPPVGAEALPAASERA